MLWLSVIMAIIPTIIILSIVYKTDKEKEPVKLLLSLFGVGILSCFLTVILSYVCEIIFPFLNNVNTKSYTYVILHFFFHVAFIEEISKWIFSYSIGWNNKEFDHQYDAVVYCVFVSLGFATFENILYSVHYGLYTSFLRGIISVPAHAAFAVIMGYYISLAKISKKTQKQYINMFLSIFVPTLLHGLYDVCFSIGQSALFVFLLLVAFLYIDSIKKISKLSKLENFTKNHLFDSTNFT